MINLQKVTGLHSSIPHVLLSLYCRYYTDPSGTFWQCNAKAIGSGSEGADSSLQEQYNKVRFKINAKLMNCTFPMRYPACEP
jgi:hypothetical protein